MPALAESWLLLALLAAALWALSCVVEVCLVGGRIFKSPLDAALVMGLFAGVPLALLAPAAGSTGGADFKAVAAAAAAGGMYFLHVYFNFRALFAVNDGSNAEIFNNLTVVFVPVLAFVLLGEHLAPVYYFAAALALCGILMLLRSQLKKLRGNVIACLLLSVLCMSIAMVAQAYALSSMRYLQAVVVFSAGCFGTALLLLVFRRGRRERVLGLCRRFGALFAGVQLVDIGAVLVSQRSTSLAPSVTLVAVAECALPLFIMGFAALFLVFPDSWRPVPDRVHSSIALQTDSWRAKTGSLALITVAIAMTHAVGD